MFTIDLLKIKISQKTAFISCVPPKLILGLAFYFYSYFLLLKKKTIFSDGKTREFSWQRIQEDSLLLLACNDHEWFVREKRTTSIEDSYENAIQIFTKKKKSPKKLKQKNIKWKLKIDWNCILKIVLHSTFGNIFFILNGFWK